MGAGKVHQLGLCVFVAQDADMAFNGNAGIVADALLEPGQAIEECALTGIGVTDNSDGSLDTPSNCYLFG